MAAESFPREDDDQGELEKPPVCDVEALLAVAGPPKKAASPARMARREARREETSLTRPSMPDILQQVRFEERVNPAKGDSSTNE